MREIHHAQDAACIAGWDNTRDLLVEDCFGESSGENFILGGADAQSEDRQPQDITLRRCTFTKPDRWRTKPNGATVKNLFELKNAKRVLVEACNFAKSWTDGQTGFGIVLTVRNQDGGNPWASVEDVTFRNCVMRDVVSGIQILGVDDTHPSGVMRRITFDRCQIEFLEGNGIQLGNGAEGITITHSNFWSPNAGKWLAFNCPDRPIVGLTITNSDASEGWYGIHGDGTAPGTPTLDVYAPSATFEGVTLWRGMSGTEQLPVSARRIRVVTPGVCPYCDNDVRDHLADCPLMAWKEQLLTVIETLALAVCAVQELHERTVQLEMGTP